MAARWLETITGSLEQKRQYRDAQARMQALPAPYRETATALERYVLHAGGISRGDALVQAMGDLADLLEQAAADGTPIRDVVGEDPVAFAEEIIANYRDGQWLEKERTRLSGAVDRAAGDAGGAP